MAEEIQTLALETFYTIRHAHKSFAITIPFVFDLEGESGRPDQVWSDKLFTSYNIRTKGEVRMDSGFYEPLDDPQMEESQKIHLEEILQCTRRGVVNSVNVYLKPEIAVKDNKRKAITNIHALRDFGGDEFIAVVGGEMIITKREELATFSEDPFNEIALIRVCYDDLARYYRREEKSGENDITGPVKFDTPMAIRTGVLNTNGKAVQFFPTSFVKTAKTRQEANCRLRLVSRRIPRIRTKPLTDYKRQFRPFTTENFWYLATLPDVTVKKGEKLLLLPFIEQELLHDGMAKRICEKRNSETESLGSSLVSEDNEIDGVEAPLQDFVNPFETCQVAMNDCADAEASSILESAVEDMSKQRTGNVIFEGISHDLAGSKAACP